MKQNDNYPDWPILPDSDERHGWSTRWLSAIIQQCPWQRVRMVRGRGSRETYILSRLLLPRGTPQAADMSERHGIGEGVCK